MSAHRITEPMGSYKHDKFLNWFDYFVIDMKLQMLGQQPCTPITMERLEEGSKLANELMDCREPGILY